MDSVKYHLPGHSERQIPRHFQPQWVPMLIKCPKVPEQLDDGLSTSWFFTLLTEELQIEIDFNARGKFQSSWNLVQSDSVLGEDLGNIFLLQLKKKNNILLICET